MGEVSRAAAASVAAQLREFLHAPTLHRPAWIHGERALPDGQVVLKLALGRFSAVNLDEMSAVDRQRIQEAARAFVRDVCLWERSSHYQVLCLAQDAAPEAIRENYRLLMALLHPDRQERGELEWPASAAQRVNEAHDVLADVDRRRDYDRAAHRSRALHDIPGEALAVPVPPRRRVLRLLRAAVVLGAIGSALLLVQAWWMEGTPQHVALLERTVPLGPTSRGSDAAPSDVPRFLVAKPRLGLEPLELLEPSRAPRRLVTWVPSPESRVSAARAAAVTPAAPVAEKAPARNLVPDAAATATDPLRLAQAMTPAPAAPAAAIRAQPVTPAASAAPAAAKAQVREIELLMARLVSSYEQGDTDALMGLFASGEPGLLKGSRTRNAYNEFFRVTRDRRLRLDRVDWQTGAESARLRGAATVIAEYVDGRGALERQVPIEIEISLREGQARMTSLSLFPEVR